jgi:hypothetical protein
MDSIGSGERFTTLGERATEKELRNIHRAIEQIELDFVFGDLPDPHKREAMNMLALDMMWFLYLTGLPVAPERDVDMRFTISNAFNASKVILDDKKGQNFQPRLQFLKDNLLIIYRNI